MLMQETAPRDAAFYRWHLFIDDLFQRYKATLPEYDVEKEVRSSPTLNVKLRKVIPSSNLCVIVLQLEFKGVTIKKLEIEPANYQNYENVNQGEPTATLRTKWVKDRVDITKGIHEDRKKYLNVKKVHYDYIHLGHDDFSYKMTVSSSRETCTQIDAQIC